MGPFADSCPAWLEGWTGLTMSEASRQTDAVDPTEPRTGYRYDAFISYRHVDPDRQWAKWLHSQLETYRPPGAVMERSDVVKPMRRVFRDEEELPVSSNLSSEIDEALERSRFLIVICSPRTPESRWVCAEIERFRAMGRGHRILALLVDGEPVEAFPAPLRRVEREVVDADGARRTEVEEVEPLAADVRAGGEESVRHRKKMAKLRFMACILGVRFDDLRQRDQLRQSRRKTLAAGAMAGLAAVMTLLAVYAVLQAGRAQRAEAVAKEQRDVALETLNALVVEAYDKLQDRPGGRQLQDSLLELALTKLESVEIERGGGDGRATLSSAIAMRRRGRLFLLAGRTDDAASLLRASASMLREMRGERPDNARVRRELATTLHRLGELRSRAGAGATDAAAKLFHEAMAVRRELFERRPNDMEVAAELARSREFVGDIAVEQGRSLEARDHYRASMALRERIAEAEPDDDGAARDLYTAYSKLGDIGRQLGEAATARDQYERAMAIAERLAEADPYNTRARRDLAVAYNKLGSVNRSVGQWPAALEHYERALEITRDLAASDRGNVQWQRELTVCLNNLGFVSENLGELEAAERYYERSLEIARDLAEADPADARLRRGLADAHQLLGDARVRKGELEEAKRSYRRAVELRRELAETDASNVQLRRDLGNALELLGDAHWRAGEGAEARRLYREALAIRRALAEADPNNTQLQRDLSIGFLRLARSTAGEAKVEAAREAAAIRRRLHEQQPDDAATTKELASAEHMLGMALAAVGEVDGSAKAFDAAAARFAGLSDARPKDAARAARAAASYGALAQVERQRGRAEAAAERMGEAAKMRRRAAEATEGEGRLGALTAYVLALHNRGRFEAEAGDVAAARATWLNARDLLGSAPDDDGRVRRLREMVDRSLAATGNGDGEGG